jgi:transcriptional regulator with XRE-family HTH domain
MTYSHTAAVFLAQAPYSAVAIPPAFGFGENIPMGYLRNLKAVRKQRGLTQQALADLVGIEQPTIQRYEKGRSPRLDQALDIARELGVSLDDLVSEGRIVPAGPRLFVKGEVRAGHWVECWEWERDDWAMFTGRSDETTPLDKRFGLKVVGDSMDIPYPEGTILDCVKYEQDYIIPSGKRVIAQRHRENGTIETTVKELVRDADGVEWLVPRSNNPKHQPFRGDEPGDPSVTYVEIIAVVVGAYAPE